MKKLLPLTIAIVLCISAKTDDTCAYIGKYSSLAVSEMQRSGIPASITMAQAILESASGTSRLAEAANNHFGIKCGKDWEGKTTYYDDDRKNECFRVYSSAEASWRDHSDFLVSSPRYKSLFSLDGNDYKAWAKGLRECGYATDRKYADKLIEIIEEYELYRLDNGEALPDGGDVKESGAKESGADVPEDNTDAVAGVRYDETVKIKSGRIVYSEGGRPYIIATEADSYKSIAKEMGLFKSELLHRNGIDRDQPIEPGTKVYLKKQRRK